MLIILCKERDCSAKSSAGELSLDDDGMNKYKKYIDEIVAEMGKYDRLDFAVVLEPDSLGNSVTNMGVAKCQKAAPAYLEGLAYAVKKLQKPNVALYIDAAHSNWLGWPGNLEPAAKLFKQVLTMAGTGAKIRGFATNVSNYNGKFLFHCFTFSAAQLMQSHSQLITPPSPMSSMALAQTTQTGPSLDMLRHLPLT